MEPRIVKTQFVADLKPGMIADTVFLCADIKSRMTRSADAPLAWLDSASRPLRPSPAQLTV